MRKPTLLACVAGLILLVGLAHALALRPGHYWGDDFSLYVGHARNLVEGRPYAETGYLYNPHNPVVGPPTYPPGCALLLAPVYALRGLDLEAMKWVMVGSFLVFLAALAACVRDRLAPGWLLLLLALVGLNHYFLMETNGISSDMPFLAFLYLAVLLIQTAYRPNAGPRWRIAAFLGAGAVAYLAFGTRTLGGLLLPALWVHDFLHHRRQGRLPRTLLSRGAIGATAVFLALAALQSLLLHSDRHYFDQLSVGPMVLVHNAIGYLGRTAAFWHNGYSAALAVAVFAAATALCVLGYVEAVRRRITVLEVFPALYLVAIFLWPSYQAERYLYPVFPLMVFYTLRGLSHAWLAARPRLRRFAVAGLVFVAAGSYAARYTTLDFGPLRQGVAKPESVELFRYVAQNTRPDDVIVFVKPRAMALFTGRAASIYHAGEDRELWRYFREIGATYLVVVETDEALVPYTAPELLAYLRGFVARQRERFTPTFANRDFTVLRLGGDEDPEVACAAI